VVLFALRLARWIGRILRRFLAGRGVPA